MESSHAETLPDAPPELSSSRPDQGELLAVIYGELRQLAHHKMRGQRPDHTLQATALVNEAYLKLAKSGADVRVCGRDQLLALAASAMRSVLVDHARSKSRSKRRPEGISVPLEGLAASYEENAIDLVGLDLALERLAELDEDAARVVELRFFGGLSVREVARILGLTSHRVEREWHLARVWLRGELE